jgi:hypothetical protein
MRILYVCLFAPKIGNLEKTDRVGFDKAYKLMKKADVIILVLKVGGSQLTDKVEAKIWYGY